jgi:hypothetical protein
MNRSSVSSFCCPAIASQIPTGFCSCATPKTVFFFCGFLDFAFLALA